MKWSWAMPLVVLAALFSTKPLFADERQATASDPTGPVMSFAPFRDCRECPEMAIMPAGEFLMGSPETEMGRDQDESPLRRLTVPRFAAGTREVSIAEWNDCVLAGACAALSAPPANVALDTPVTRVSWNKANKYTQWLSNKTGRSYRLLTEVEWEYAARAGARQPFAFGATIGPEVALYAWNYSFNRSRRAVAPSGPTRVAAYAPNAWGLYDMHGNVWEWTADCYVEVYPLEPSGETSDETRCMRRVIRGGGWNSGPQALRFANREWESPDRVDSGIGFRVARSLEN